MGSIGTHGIIGFPWGMLSYPNGKTYVAPSRYHGAPWVTMEPMVTPWNIIVVPMKFMGVMGSHGTGHNGPMDFFHFLLYAVTCVWYGVLLIRWEPYCLHVKSMLPHAEHYAWLPCKNYENVFQKY
jgi:hypothetical protein